MSDHDDEDGNALSAVDIIAGLSDDIGFDRVLSAVVVVAQLKAEENLAGAEFALTAALEAVALLREIKRKQAFAQDGSKPLPPEIVAIFTRGKL